MMSNKIITYVFTSPCGGVGKTTMSVACAKAHALQGRLGNKNFENSTRRVSNLAEQPSMPSSA